MDQTQLAEIEALRSVQVPTRRTTVPALEDILYTALPVLDHGFIRVIDYMGDDSRIAQAARVSYGRGTKTAQKDAGLVNYLMRHRHTSPFEMCELTLHVKLPIFVARQWIRHRTANVNEYSARYSILSPEFYVPRPEHLAVQSTANRQGRDQIIDESKAKQILDDLIKHNERSYKFYAQLLNDAGDGTPSCNDVPMLARELARMVLPLCGYTEWYWKIDLHNLFHFLGLRADIHAQYEIRAYAETLSEIVKTWVPHAFGAFTNHMVRGKRFSGTEMELLARMLRGEEITFETSGLSKGEWGEFRAKLPPLGHHKYA